MTPSSVQSGYSRILASSIGPGELVTLVRAGDSNVYQAHAWVTEFIPQDLAGAVEQGKRRAIVLASDVIASGFPLPFRPKQDRLIWGTKNNATTSVDDATRRFQGVLIAYEMDLDGA